MRDAANRRIERGQKALGGFAVRLGGELTDRGPFFPRREPEQILLGQRPEKKNVASTRGSGYMRHRQSLTGRVSVGSAARLLFSGLPA
jgi:hypothetical protein